MKKIILTLIIAIFAFSVQAQLNWSENSVKTLKKGRKELGLFAPLKYGLKDSLELSVHPLYFFIIPHVGMKKHWGSIGSWELGSKHNFVYPSLLYKAISRRATGGILPETAKIPHLFKFNNAILFGKELNEHHSLTLKAGLDLTLSLGEGDFPEIEYHIVYPRTYAFNNLITPYLGAGATGQLFRKVNYSYDLTTFFFAKAYKGMNVENNLKIQWNKSDKFAVRAGVLYVSGTYPFGKDSKLFPLFDIMFAF